MIHLSVNINKIATLRNSRGGDIPSVLEAAKVVLDSGAHGITVHPREDERHIRKSDVMELVKFIKEYNLTSHNKIEYNIEGEPSERFLKLVEAAEPDQITLVPVTPGEITSDHGFIMQKDAKLLETWIKKAKGISSRISLFVDAGVEDLEIAKEIGADRIELYTGPFAHQFELDSLSHEEMMEKYESTARQAIMNGLGINAGHDLDHENLKVFSKLSGLKEVSIGHRLISSAIYKGLSDTVKMYVEILKLHGNSTN
jgi:pyridoxine 5-phosphate synthase